MGQVPAFSSYLVIGDGRVARHFKRYFEFEVLPFFSWSRRHNTEIELLDWVTRASHVLLLINDGAIETFLHENPCLQNRVCVHMSGALSMAGAVSAHPLMTFSDHLYDLAFYRSIPFVIERGHSLQWLLPGLRNPSFDLAPQHRVLYHALCVLTGNFTVLLWEKAFREFADQFDLPKEVLIPYLTQTAKNLAAASAGESVLTGPLVRGDLATIDRHLGVLVDDPFRDVYLAFTTAFQFTTEFQKEAHDEVGTRLSQIEITR
jgi:predicted short-subunit dehydrogenase-like oxidoreductase (DUF2520 family)